MNINKEVLQNSAKLIAPELISIRRHLHQNPELSFQEYETSKYIISYLEQWGVKYEANIAGTGIVASVEGQNPEKAVIALRGDMDALPILEENELTYCSQNKGVMHACGHDVHTTCLLGALKLLHDQKENWEGTVHFIFQPGEEKLPGGASIMIKEGILERYKPQRIIGQHVYPQLEVGKVGIREGMYMASADEIYVTIKGKGGHAALPHQNVDTVVMTAHIITALQQVVSRYNQPDIPAVLSFGKINSVGGATNIIPNEVKLEGTFRTMNETERFRLHKMMKNLAESMAESLGGSCHFDIHVGYPYLENDPKVAQLTRKAMQRFLGEENVEELNLRMTAEDFAYFSQAAPSVFYRLGVAPRGGKSSGLHTSTFNVDEHCLEVGASTMVWVAIQQLNDLILS